MFFFVKHKEKAYRETEEVSWWGAEKGSFSEIRSFCFSVCVFPVF